MNLNKIAQNEIRNDETEENMIYLVSKRELHYEDNMFESRETFCLKH